MSLRIVQQLPVLLCVHIIHSILWIRHLVGVLDSLFQKHNKELDEKYQQQLEQQEGEKKYPRGLGNQKNAFIFEFNIFNIYIFLLLLTKT